MSREEWAREAKKAFVEYDVPQAYFMLAKSRGVTPHYRSVEIENKFLLRPNAALRVFPNDVIEGIYESLTGVIESVMRDDVEMADYFFDRLKPEAVERLRDYIETQDLIEMTQGYYFDFRCGTYNRICERAGLARFALSLPKWQRRFIQEQILPNTLEEQKRTLKYYISQGSLEAVELGKQVLSNKQLFLSCLRSGVKEILDSVFYLRDELGLSYPRGNKLDRVIGSIPFSTNVKDYAIGIGKGKVDPDYFYAAAYSGNPQFIDFLLRIGKFEGSYAKLQENLQFGMREKINPVGFYQVYQRMFLLYFSGYPWVPSTDIDMVILASSDQQRNLPEYIEDALLETLGNIPILFYFLKLSPDDALDSLQIINLKGYAYTQKLLS